MATITLPLERAEELKSDLTEAAACLEVLSHNVLFTPEMHSSLLKLRNRLTFHRVEIACQQMTREGG